MKFQGKVKQLGELMVTGENGDFKRQTVLVDCTESFQGREYPNVLDFTFENDKVDELDKLKDDQGKLKAESIPVVIDNVWPKGVIYDEKDKETGQLTGEKKHFQYLRATKCELAQ